MNAAGMNKKCYSFHFIKLYHFYALYEDTRSPICRITSETASSGVSAINDLIGRPIFILTLFFSKAF